MAVSREELRRWLEGRRAAAAREDAEQAAASCSSAQSLARALHLVNLARTLHGWPLPSEAAAAREDALGYERWARLRRR